jgi:hypothetical protein
MEPTSLVRAASAAQPATERYGNHVVQLSANATAVVQSVARTLRVTVNVLVQAAWALILSRHSRSVDVVFGTAFAGRPSDLPGAESIVGPFVNNVPLRIQIDPAATFAEFLQRTHARLLEVSTYQFTPLMDIQRVSEVPWRYRLFESVVVFQNYVVDDSARRLGRQVEIDDFVGPIHTNYPVMLLAEPGGELRLTLIHDRRRVSQTDVEAWGRDLALLVEGGPELLSQRLAELQNRLSPPSSPSIALRAPVRASSLNYVAPQTEMEKTIASVWQSMFGIDQVGIEESFFELGGHSLLLVQMHERLRTVLNRPFPIVALFEHPTVSALARYLDPDAASVADKGEQHRARAQRQREAIAQMRAKFKKDTP